MGAADVLAMVSLSAEFENVAVREEELPELVGRPLAYIGLQ